MVIQLAKAALLNKVDQEVPVLPTSLAHTELQQEVELQQAKVLEEAQVIRSIENICTNEKHFLYLYSCIIEKLNKTKFIYFAKVTLVLCTRYSG